MVCLGDGAEWVKNIARTHFGHAQFIIDFYHAKQHVGDLCRYLFGTDNRRVEHYREQWVDLLAVRRGEPHPDPDSSFFLAKKE